MALIGALFGALTAGASISGCTQGSRRPTECFDGSIEFGNYRAAVPLVASVLFCEKRIKVNLLKERGHCSQFIEGIVQELMDL